MDYTKELIEKIIPSLPNDMLTLLMDKSWRQKVVAIASQNQLDEDQRESLKLEIFFVLSGLKRLSDFRQNLMAETGVSYDQALKISIDVNSGIFVSILQTLKEFERQISADELEAEQNTGVEERGEDAPHEDVRESEPIGAIDHMLPTHEQMEAMDGAHDHTPAQSSTPTPAPTPAPAREPSFPLPDTTARVYTTAQSTPVHKISSGLPDSLTRASSGAPATPTIPMMPTMPSFNATAMAAGQGAATRPTSIVDQKLRGLVRGEREETHIRDDIEQQRKAVYKENDPYREPIE